MSSRAQAITVWAAFAFLGAVGPSTAHILAFPVGDGHRFRDTPWAPELSVIPPGTMVMGASEVETRREGKSEEKGAWERPQHMVVVNHSFAIGTFDVTLGEFKRFIAATSRPMTGGCMVLQNGVWSIDSTRSSLDPAFAVDDRYPVTCVNRDDARAYVQWLSKTTGHVYRLPHEAEWEYAARGGTTSSRWWGEARVGLCKYVNGADRSFSDANPKETRVDRSCDDGYVQTSPVGVFPPNPYGLYDMFGDVEQWTDDCFVPSYVGAPNDSAHSVEGGDCMKVAVRGGTFHSDAPLFRAANRGFLPPSMRASSVGFRVVRLPDYRALSSSN